MNSIKLDMRYRRWAPDVGRQTPSADFLLRRQTSDARRRTPDAITFGASERRIFNSIRDFLDF